MRYIEIAQRFRPFSHRPGVKLLVPESGTLATVYPARLLFGGDYAMNIQGPVKEFTTTLDLERGVVTVSGHAANGFFRYKMRGSSIFVEREPEGGLGLPSEKINSSSPLKERLALGSHKKQEIEKLTTLEEILPLWHALAQHTPEGSGSGGVLDFFSGKSVDFLSAYRAGFEGLFSPRLIDTDFQGFSLSSPFADSSPLAVIKVGASRIRSLFITEEGGALSLHPTFHSGRLTGWCFGHQTVDMEWMGGLLRKVKISSSQKTTLSLLLPREIKSFRIRQRLTERGIDVPRDQLLELSSEPLFLDRFER